MPPGELFYPRYSPEGTKIAFMDGPDIRIYDDVRGASPQFTSGGGMIPTWSWSGEDLYYFAVNGLSAMVRRADSGEEASRLWEQGGPIIGTGPGDSLLVVLTQNSDVVLARMRDGVAQFEDFLATPWSESNLQVSPDGRWIA